MKRPHGRDGRPNRSLAIQVQPQQHKHSSFFCRAPGGKRGHMKEKCRRRWEPLLPLPHPPPPLHCPENKRGAEKKTLQTIVMNKSPLFPPLQLHPSRRLLTEEAAARTPPASCSSPADAATLWRLSGFRLMSVQRYFNFQNESPYFLPTWHPRTGGIGQKTWGSNRLSVLHLRSK